MPTEGLVSIRMLQKRTGEPKGCGFLEFDTPEAQKVSLQSFLCGNLDKRFCMSACIQVRLCFGSACDHKPLVACVCFT